VLSSSSLKVTALNEKDDPSTGMVQPDEKRDVTLEHPESGLALALASKDT
jgi:hypothetical protein